MLGSNENSSYLSTFESTSTVLVDSPTNIQAGVTQVTDVSDAYNTNIYRTDNSIRDNSTRLLDSLNTVFNAPSISTGGAASALSGMGLDLRSFFNMPSTGSTAKLNPSLAGGFFDSGIAQKTPAQNGSQSSIIGTIVKVIVIAAVVYFGFKLFKRFKK